MYFADFVNVLKRHFRRTISNDELCGILFDSIIRPSDLKNRNGEIPTIEKNEISRIMSRKINIPSLLREHVYDEAVFNGLTEYFQVNIVSELVPDQRELFHQIMKLIDADDDISPEHKASLRILANPNSVAAFLADAFVYVIRHENKSRIPKETAAELSKPILKLCGITASDELSSDVEAAYFHPKHKFTLAEYEARIRQLYHEIAELNLIKDEPLRLDSRLMSVLANAQRIAAMQLSMTGEPVVINRQSRTAIEVFAERLNIRLPNDFFDIGDLRCRHARLSFVPPKFYGDEFGQRKYAKITELLENIESYKNLEPVNDFFRYIRCIRLALRNDGSAFDEGVTVRLKIDKNALIDDRYLQYCDAYILQTIIDDFSDIFNIERTANYFRYESSDVIPEMLPVRNSSRGLPNPNRNLIEEWNELFPYFMTVDEVFGILEITFDEIMQHTAIAFPTVLLLKNPVTSIEYEIRSKSLSEAICGTLTVTLKGDINDGSSK